MTIPIITAEEFVERAIEALGGRSALQDVFSIHVQLERCLWLVDADPVIMKLDLYRAQGGRIRMEEYTSENDRQVTILNGLSGVRQREERKQDNFQIVEHQQLSQVDVEEIKRSVRLYPRNFLAHADEHQFQFFGLQQFENEQVYLLDLLVEEVSYHFSPESLLCLRVIDRRSDSVTSYEEYQQISGIYTPMLERLIKAQRNFRVDTIKSITYNLPLADELFDAI